MGRRVVSVGGWLLAAFRLFSLPKQAWLALPEHFTMPAFLPNLSLGRLDSPGWRALQAESGHLWRLFASSQCSYDTQ